MSLTVFIISICCALGIGFAIGRWKYLKILIAFTAISLCYGSPTPTPFDITKVDTSTISADEIAKTIAHRNDLYEEQQKANEATQSQIKDQAQTLVNAAQTNDASAKALAAYQSAVAEVVNKANAAIAQLNSVIKKLHRAKWILCGIWILLCCIAYTKVPLILKSYGLYIVGGLAAAGIAAIWIWV